MGKKKNKSLITPLLTLLAILITGFLGYSVITYQNSQQEQEGFFTCNKDATICELSQHIHADIAMNVCGEEIVFPKEKGDITKQHTHKEENKIHWQHESMRVDPIAREPLDKTPFTISAFLEQMGHKFPNSCPNNNSPKLEVSVNGKIIKDGLNYVWKDADIISIGYN